MNNAGELKKKQSAGSVIGLVVLVGLMLVGSYLGSMWQTQRVSSTLPMERVPLDTQEKQEVILNTDDALPSPTGDAQKAPVIYPAETGFAGYKETIARARNTSAALLDEVIESASASTETVRQALQQKTELASAMSMEAEMEALLHARGFDSVLCTVNQQSVNVVVKGADLTQQQASQILDIAMSVSGQPASNVRIIPSD